MQDELSFLIALQTHDAAIDELQAKADALNPVIQKKTQSLENLKSSLKTAKEKITAFQAKKKALELDADAQEKLIQKHQGALNSLKSNDAYKAMLGEIEAAKKQQTKIEDDILEVMQSAEAADAEYKEGDKKLKSDESAIKSEIQSLEKQKADILAQVQGKQAERDTFAATAPVNLKNQYDSLRKRRGGSVIVPVVNNACGGCKMNITQNKIVEVKKAKAMVLCDSCMRILYLPSQEKPAAPSDQTPDQSQAIPANQP
jgi:uncharacterized protein